jgi:hypothetical protein
VRTKHLPTIFALARSAAKEMRTGKLSLTTYLIVSFSYDRALEEENRVGVFLQTPDPITATMSDGKILQFPPGLTLTGPFDIHTVINLSALFRRLPGYRPFAKSSRTPRSV